MAPVATISVFKYSSCMPCNFTLSHSAPVETIRLDDGHGSPLKSVTGPYDATSLHTFINETFPGAVLLEEHQVNINSSCTVIQ